VAESQAVRPGSPDAAPRLAVLAARTRAAEAEAEMAGQEALVQAARAKEHAAGSRVARSVAATGLEGDWFSPGSWTAKQILPIAAVVVGSLIVLSWGVRRKEK
jgi:hypothetical protein